MENYSLILIIIFWIWALGLSVFFGLKAGKIFLTKEELSGKPFAWKFFQFWLNFVGSIVGWIIIWILLPKLVAMMKGNINLGLSLTDIIALLVSFIAITGYLPSAIVGLIMSIRDLILKFGSFIKIQK